MGSLVVDLVRYHDEPSLGTVAPIPECVLLPPDAAEATWQRTMPFLRRAMKEAQGELTESAIRAGVACQIMSVWVVMRENELLGVLLTQVVEYPSSLRSLQITLMSGSKFRLWMGIALDELLMFAKTEHCTRLEAIGRKGLSKLLAPCGFEPAYQTVIREVTSGKKRRR